MLKTSKISAGFQLVELLLALGLIALLAGLSFDYTSHRHSLPIQRLAFEIAEFIHAARALALESGIPVQLSIPQEYCLALHSKTHHQSILLREYTCKACTIEFHGFREGPLIFYEFGATSSNGRFKITANHQSCAVILNDAGRVRIDC